MKQSEIASRIATLRQLSESGESQEALKFFVTYWLTTGTGSNSGEQGANSGGGGSSLINEPQVKADLDKRYLDLHLLLDRLQLQLGEDHVNVRKLRQQLATMKQFYDDKSYTPPQITDVIAGDGMRLRLRPAAATSWRPTSASRNRISFTCRISISDSRPIWTRPSPRRKPRRCSK
jgi:hypothetical protein